MMTAYVILKAHPLQPGESGPTVTLTAADASRFIQMQSEDQSVLAVEGGDRFTELELLRGMLIASANNFAEIVANWDAGAVTTFVGKMNTEAQALGMTQTHYADASGFSSSSTSTPADQLKLAVAAMQNPVFAQIVGTESIRLPNVGLIENVNTLLGEQGVVGIKTGFTEQAGGNLAFAAKRNLQGAGVTILGMVLGQPSRQAAFASTRTLLSAVDQGLQFTQVVKAGQVVGTLKTPEGKTVDLVAREDATMMLWPGMTLQAEVQLDALKAPLQRGDQAGTLVLRLGEQEARIAVDLAGDVTKPGLLWKLQRF
ncbi:MAG TPA: D-alanyl-D-alanine carboxypeptidase, partial [Dehalococcoidia bacterium]|nr:D-alanyl-D-alanine carboxypeptidase [Dehalococcoidia bacterium]